MLLKQLLEEVDHELLAGSLDTEITDIVIDSRKDCAGAAFVCITGTNVDSHKFIPQVVEKGAAAVIIEHDAEIPEGVAAVCVKDARLALAQLSAAYFGHPTRSLTAIGVTGTKGKTTTTYMIKAILEQAGKKVGLIGTNGAVIDGVLYPTKNTTPESYDLQHYFRMMLDAGCEYMVMEVSSQGLMMNRVAGIDFDYGLFTNISPDHIGPNEHASFEEYMECKSRLFRMCETGIVNADDQHCGDILAGHTCKVRTYGIYQPADFTACDIMRLKKGSFMGVTFTCRSAGGSFGIHLGTPGMFSVYNALAATAVALSLGIDEGVIDAALSNLRVNGRMELVYASDQCTVIVDYAHNGVSTESLLSTLKEYDPPRLVVVFGCGGNRDPHRRYEMGEAVGRYADLAIVTEDNSRYEDVMDIIKDIHIGLDPTGGDYIDIPDRRDAIRYSIEKSQPGDLIAIIGKGHEDYQEIKGVRTHFLDREEAEKVLNELGWVR